jgi:hypothetical protein
MPTPSKLLTLQRRATVFAVVSVLLGFVWVFRSDATTTQTKEDLPRLFEGFSGANAHAIELVQAGGAAAGAAEKRVKLVRRVNERTGEDAWVVASSFDHPANQDNVSRLLSELANARVSGEVTRRADTFTQYLKDGGKDGDWVKVTVTEQAGKELARLGVGARSWKTGETNVLLETGGPPRVVRVRDLTEDSARAASDAWLKTRIFDGLESKDVESFEVVQKVELDGKASTRTLAFTKRPQEAAKEGEGPPPERGWDMTSPTPGPALRTAVEDALRSMTGMLFEEVVDKLASGDGDAKYGFAAPEVVARVTLAPPGPGQAPVTARLVLGALDPAKQVWYARRGDQPYVYTVKDAEWTTGRLRNDPSKFVEAPKEPEKPPEPAAPPAPPPEGSVGDPDGTPPEGEKPPEPAPAPPTPAEQPK